MRTKLLRLLAVVLAFGLVAAACGDDDDEVAGEGDGELKIGYVLPQTGQLSVIVDALVKPIEMGVSEIEAAGGEVTIVTGDSGTDPAVASTTVDNLLADDVDVVLGAAASGVSLSVIDKITGSNVVHMGDQMFSGLFPFVDIDGGGTVEGYRKNIAKVLELIEDMPGVKVIPGHGPLATPADLKAQHDMIAETRGVVEKHMKAGKSLEEIVEAGLPEKYDSWSWRFIDTKRWIETLHRDLSGE